MVTDNTMIYRLTRQEQEDLMLAQAIAASQQEASRNQQRQQVSLSDVLLWN